MLSVMSNSNIRLPEPRFGFDESPETLTRVRQRELEYSKPNIRIFDLDYLIRHRYLQKWSRIHFLLMIIIDQRRPFFLIDESTSKFIEINGNPSIFYVIDCYKTHYDTQINQIIKITHKISLLVLSCHQPSSLSHVHCHQILCIHLINDTVDESRQQPVMQTLHRFHRFRRKSISTVSQR